jgi:hypothetical protein
MRQHHNNEVADLENVIEELKNKLVELQKLSMDEEERLKVKLAELREADIRSLRDYYEN